MTNSNSKKLVVLVLVLLMAVTGLSLQAFTASAAVKTDPSFAFTAGGANDYAHYKEDGTIELAMTPFPGFGMRTNASNLGALNKFDVKDFSITFSVDETYAPITTIFSLQTMATGTIGDGHGNGIQIMVRCDAAGSFTIGIMDQPAATYHGLVQGAALGADNKVTVTFDYENNNLKVQAASTVNFVTKAGVDFKTLADTTYAGAGYKAHLSFSNYFFGGPPSTAKTQVTIHEVNGMTPGENYAAIVDEKLTEFELAADALDTNSTSAEVLAAAEKNIFGEGVYKTLLDLVDDNALSGRIEAAQQVVNTYMGAAEFEVVKEQLENFETVLGNSDLNDPDELSDAIAAYDAIDRNTIGDLPEVYQDEVENLILGIVSQPKFKQFAEAKTEKYLNDLEAIVFEGDDLAALSTYKSVIAAATDWAEYKEYNFIIDDLFTANEIEGYDGRIAAIEAALEDSYYSQLWTEGDTWEARITDQGLYASGEGKYYETLGFNQKFELGKDSSQITFNIIYALRVLGSNHLHIGFYPVANTGTLGDVDGVRVDFWFSAVNTVEVKPVNGKDEQNNFEGGYLSVADTGLFDMEDLDYTVGKYTVAIYEDDGVLVLFVNGYEMELSMSPELFADGCYITLSAMSVAGADYNELVVTSIGDHSFVEGLEPGYIDDEDDDDDDNGGGGGGRCNSAAGSEVALLMAAAAVGGLSFKRTRKRKLDKNS